MKKDKHGSETKHLEGISYENENICRSSDRFGCKLGHDHGGAVNSISVDGGWSRFIAWCVADAMSVRFLHADTDSHARDMTDNTQLTSAFLKLDM